MLLKKLGFFCFMDMHCLVLISCCWLLKKTLVITTNLTNPESASDKEVITHQVRCYHSFLVEIIVENVNMKNMKAQGKKLYVTRNKGFYRSSRPEVFCKKDVLRSFTKFTGKHPCQSLLFNKVVGRPATLLKRRF